MLMGGLSSDIHDHIAPRLQLLSGPSSAPTSFPSSPSLLLLILLPPTLLLPLLPPPLMPYLLLPLGYTPPLLFHPNLTPAILSLPRHPAFLRIRALFERAALTDNLPDDIGRSPIGRVEVWENERLDPGIAAKPPPGAAALPNGAWSSRHLRAGERAPWVKVCGQDALWRSEQAVVGTGEDKKEGEKMVLALENGWEFIPGEDWRVDVCGLWSETGTDEGESVV